MSPKPVRSDSRLRPSCSRLPGCAKKPAPADLVLLNGDVYTVDPAIPAAKALVITGNTITAVCASDREARRYVGQKTRVIDLQGKFVLPGLIDGHVHFAAAGGMLEDANLLMVSDVVGLRKEIQRVVNLLDDDEWITDGMWGAYEQWAAGDAGGGRKAQGSLAAEPEHDRRPAPRTIPASSAGSTARNGWPTTRALADGELDKAAPPRHGDRPGRRRDRDRLPAIAGLRRDRARPSSRSPRCGCSTRAGPPSRPSGRPASPRSTTSKRRTRPSASSSSRRTAS